MSARPLPSMTAALAALPTHFRAAVSLPLLAPSLVQGLGLIFLL